jgi:transcriptional regulator with XRE-family HTH domain
MSQLKEDFGKRLQQLRLETGLTQEQLADEIGVTIESISNIERGIHGPKFETLERLAVALDVSVKELFYF